MGKPQRWHLAQAAALGQALVVSMLRHGALRRRRDAKAPARAHGSQDDASASVAARSRKYDLRRAPLTLPLRCVALGRCVLQVCCTVELRAFRREVCTESGKTLYCSGALQRRRYLFPEGFQFCRGMYRDERANRACSAKAMN